MLPVNAQELSSRIPTASVYEINDEKLLDLSYSFTNNYYKVFLTEDSIGLEVSSAFKNVYAIAIGIFDGLYKKSNIRTHNNLNAFIFNQTVQETSKIVKYSGGSIKTLFGLGEIDDLFAASNSSRNNRLGKYIGMGKDPSVIYKKMYEMGEIAEGYKALSIGAQWIKAIGLDFQKDLPLMEITYRIVFKGLNAKEGFNELIMKLMLKILQ